MAVDKTGMDWAQAKLGSTVHRNTASASGTYQASAANRGRRHVLCAAKDIFVTQGTGASVSAAAGHLVKAGTQFFFRPDNKGLYDADYESLGYITADGSNFAAATPLTISLYGDA